MKQPTAYDHWLYQKIGRGHLTTVLSCLGGVILGNGIGAMLLGHKAEAALCLTVGVAATYTWVRAMIARGRVWGAMWQ